MSADSYAHILSKVLEKLFCFYFIIMYSTEKESWVEWSGVRIYFLARNDTGSVVVVVGCGKRGRKEAVRVWSLRGRY